MQRENSAKLDWPYLLKKLADHCQTPDGKSRALELKSGLTKAEILARWDQVIPLVTLTRQGYYLTIGECEPVAKIVTAAEKGQILDGKDLRTVFIVLAAVTRVHAFAYDFAPRCKTLEWFKHQLVPLPTLARAIEKAIDPDGRIRDDASPELTKIRRQKTSIRTRIEDRLKKLLQQDELHPYLQDEYFTMRAERYVVPIRIDGRGRVPGSIVDTSASGQTLLIEPAVIATMNQELQECDLAEKLEILRIFKELTVKVAVEASSINGNYQALIELDFLWAQAHLAYGLDATAIKIVDEPRLHLVQARHPLVRRSDGSAAVANDIQLKPNQHALIISGPNAGGKTVGIKTAGVLSMMLASGLLIPADETSELSLFTNIHIEMGDAQDLAANLSTFTGHISGLKPILSSVGPTDLVLLDELAVGTEPQTGAAIAQAILEELVRRKAMVLATTHFDNLKALALHDQRFRNGSMEYSIDTSEPTFRLIHDVPGQSFGLEIAKREGLDARLIARARELRGRGESDFDHAIASLKKMEEDLHRGQAALAEELKQAQAEKLRWQQEIALIRQTRQNAAKSVGERFEPIFENLRNQAEDLFKELREKKGKGALDTMKHAARDLMKAMDQGLNQLGTEYAEPKDTGSELKPEDLKVGASVFVASLSKEGTISQIGGSGGQVEVAIGTMKVKVPRDALRLSTRSRSERHSPAPMRPAPKKAPKRESLVGIQTSTNTLDIRGTTVEEALEKMWRFVDAGYMRGESSLIILHGHGTASLKNAIRNALNDGGPYEIEYRPGAPDEGGDSVTILFL